MSELGLMMPFSVPMTTRVGESGLFIPPEFQNSTTVGIASRRIQLPPGKCTIRFTWDGPEQVHIQAARMNGATPIAPFRNILTIPAGKAGEIRSSSIVEIASATPVALIGGVTGGASAATVGAGYTVGVEVIPSASPDAVEGSGSAQPNPPAAAGFITPQDFGAKANGVADDTKAIQAALDSVPDSGGVVLFPVGTYIVSGQRLRYGSQDTQGALFPKPNTTLRGEGVGSIIRLNNGTNKVDMIYAFQTPGLGFENIAIDAGPRLLPYWTTCIQLNTCNDLRMRNVTVVNGNIEGIYVFNSTGFDINGIHAHHNGAYREDASGLHMDSCYGGNIDNINVHHNGFHGVIISSSWEINMSNIQARHNGWQGMHIQTGSNKINVSNAVLANNSRGLYIRDWGTDNNIFNNLTVAHNSFNGVMTWVTYGNVINGLQAISNGEYGVQTAVNDDELFVWAAHFSDNGWGDYDSVDDSKLYINGTLV